MERHRTSTTSTLILVLLLALLPMDSVCSYKCNTKLLNTFRLKGLKNSISEEMEICPTVRDTCCSMFDQVEILQLWKKTSYFKVQQHYNEMEKWDDKILNMFFKFKKLQKTDMIFFYKNETPAPYVHHFCYYKTTPLRSYPAQILGDNMDWMLQGQGSIRGKDMTEFRKREYRIIKSKGVDDKSASYRFKERSAKKFYKEFKYIADLMYYMRRLPYYHKVILQTQEEFDSLPITGVIKSGPKLSLPSDIIKSSPARQRLRRKRKSKNMKPDTYKFSDKFAGKYDNEISGLYGGGRMKGGKRGKRGRKGKKGKKSKKKKRRRGRFWLKRQLKDSGDKGKTSKSSDANSNVGPQTSDYVNQNIEELKVKRRKKRLPQAPQAKGKSLKFRPRIDLKRGKHRRRLRKKDIHTHQTRKLKDLKGKISKQWNQVFGHAPLPPANQMLQPNTPRYPPQMQQMQGSPSPGQPQNRTPVEQGKVQFQNMSYSTTPNGAVPLQRGLAQQASPQMTPQMTPQMLQQMYAQMPQQSGLSSGRLLEADHGGNQSDREILEKLRVTKIALKALKSLKRSYGKSYAKHMMDIQGKIKYFSGYVMKGDPIRKLKLLKQKLDNANSLIKRKEKRKLRLRLKKKKKPKKKKHRKLFFKKIGKFFSGLGKAGGKALIDIKLKELLSENPNPPLKKLLKTLKLGKVKNLFAKLKLVPMNPIVAKLGTKSIGLAVGAYILSKKFVVGLPNWDKVIGFGPKYESNLKKLDKKINKAKKILKKKNKQIEIIKKKLKDAISINDREYQMYQKTNKTPVGKSKRNLNSDLLQLKNKPNVNIREFLGINSIDCGLQMRTFIHKTANHSPLKEKYCKYVFKNFRKIRIKELQFYTKLARKEMISMLAMKKSLYCGVCDATLQNNFDDKHKLILYSQRFCHDLISQYKDYIKFRHIILIEFYDQFFQLMSCFEFRNELGVDYPYRTMLEAKKRRIHTIKRCLVNLNTPDFYRYCYFVCSQFNILKFSAFFDGDINLLKTLYAKFTMFFRRYQVYRKNFELSKKKKKRKRKRKLRLKHQKSIKEAVGASVVDTETGLSSDPLMDKQNKVQLTSEKNNVRTNPVKKAKKQTKKSKLGHQAKLKMKSLKKHFARVNNSLTDEISMLVMNHKKRTNQKQKELANRKKYLQDYQDGIKGKKILSQKHTIEASKEKVIDQKQKTIQIDTKSVADVAKPVPKSAVEPKAEKSNQQSLWGRKRILESAISQTFSNDLQNSFFEKRMEQEARQEASLTQSVELSSDDDQNQQRNLNLKLKGGHSDDPSEEVNKKIKTPKKKMSFSYAPKKKLTPAQKIRRKVSYLKFHTESDRLPKYYPYKIDPNLRKTYTESIYSKSIYHKTHLPFEIKTFRPFFVSSIHGFNPLRTTEMMRLDFDPRQIIALTKKKNYKPEKLVGTVVKSYLSFNKEDMAGFKHDVDLDFFDYRHTNDKNYSTRTVHPKFKLVNKKTKPQFRRDDSKPFKPQTPWEFHNPDMQDLHGHSRKNSTRNSHAHLWQKIFGR